MSEPIRSFIAVKIPPEAAEVIGAAQVRLRAAGGDVKWVEPESFHITLKFLGGVERERLMEVWRATTEALDGSAAFTMRFRGIGAFPNAGRARVVWAGIVEGADELTEMAARVEAACATHGFERERRPFRAHVTLGRVRRPAANPALEAAIGEQAEAELGEARVDRALLMKSELTRAGAVYHILEETVLGRRES
jgi:2'-5' RNA ligase